MSARFDEMVWSGVERRLAEVESLIPDAPPWSRPADALARGRVRRGSAFGRPGARPHSRRRQLVLVIVVIAALLALVAVALLVGAPRQFVNRLDEPFGPFGIHRSSDAGGSAVVLPDGRVLIASGTWQQMGTSVGSGMDIWEPASGRSPTGPAVVERIMSAATLLLDGRVLVTGGFGGPYAYPSSALAAAELWDPRTGAFSPTGSMLAPRVSHTATLLPDGRVLVVGGTGPDGIIATAELWDPRTGTFRPVGQLAGSDGFQTATLLPSGDVLILGRGPAQVWRARSESFTPAPGVLSSLGPTTATALLDGRVLVIRGAEPGQPQGPPAAFILSGESTTPIGSLLRPRSRYATTLLPDGRVAITGGVETEQGPPMGSVEVFDPASGTFTEGSPLGLPVENHLALLLPDGRVLIVFDVNGLGGQAEPFIYDPNAVQATE